MDIAELLEYMHPNVRDAIVQSGLAQERAGVAKQQFGIGQEMAATPAAQGRTVRGIYTAASPVEHLANALRQYKGNKMMQGAMEQQQGYIDQQGKGTGSYLDLARAALGKRPAPTEMPELDMTQW